MTLTAVEVDIHTLTLWDSAASPSGQVGLIYCWNGYSETDSVYSLLRYVEAHGEQLRLKYLTWIHDMGESRIGGRRLIDQLAFDDGLSYWWMTLFVEKSPYKSPITDAIRLLALEEIVNEQRPNKFRLVSAKRSLHEAIGGLCRSLGIAYEWERLSDTLPWQRSLRRIFYSALPYSVQAVISLTRYLLVRWPLRQMEKSGWFGGDKALFICSYFDNVDPKAAENGHFRSYYWVGLHALLNRIGYQNNWIQLFVPCEAVPTPRAAMSWARRFNQQRLEQGCHTFLDAYLSWPIVLRVLKRWFWLNAISWRLRGVQHAFCPRNSRISLWPLMQGDWFGSMRGPVAIDNLLCIELFDVVFKDLPHQKRGLYLCESQAWERALIHCWRKHGHGQLIAVPHGAVRFWHLSYFSDPRTVRSSAPYPMPQADLVALNGRMAIDAYLSLDYPKEAITECEALRFGNRHILGARRSLKKAKDAQIKVLIFGDYLPSSTIRMLRLVEDAVPKISGHMAYTVKSHPNNPVKTVDYPSLHLKITTDPMEKVLQDFDVAYSSNMTSAVLEAYFAGLPVVVMLDGMELNFSPLRGQPGARFVHTPEELAEALGTVAQGMATNPDYNEFFFWDPELPRWSRLLEN